MISLVYGFVCDISEKYACRCINICMFICRDGTGAHYMPSFLCLNANEHTAGNIYMYAHIFSYEKK